MTEAAQWENTGGNVQTIIIQELDLAAGSTRRFLGGETTSRLNLLSSRVCLFLFCFFAQCGQGTGVNYEVGSKNI